MYQLGVVDVIGWFVKSETKSRPFSFSLSVMFNLTLTFTLTLTLPLTLRMENLQWLHLCEAEFILKNDESFHLEGFLNDVDTFLIIVLDGNFAIGPRTIHPVFLVIKINNRYEHGRLHVNIFERGMKGMVVVTDEFANDPHMPMRAYHINHVSYCIHDGRLHLKIVQDDVSAWIDFMAPEKLTRNLVSETSICFQGVFLGTLIYKLFAPVSWLQ